MESNNKKAGGYKAALMKNQDPAAAAQGFLPAATKTPNQANQGMPAILTGEQVQVQSLLSVMEMRKKAKEEEFRRAQEEEDKLAAFLLEVQARFPGKKMMLVDEGADLIPRPTLPEPAHQPEPRQENGHHERPRWTPTNNWDQVAFVVKGDFAPFVCRRAGCPQRGKEFWGNIGQYRKKECNGCNRGLVPIKPEDQVGHPLYLCPNNNCAYMWTYHCNDNLRMKLSEAPVQDCPICQKEDVAPHRIGNDRLLAAWLVKGALNEWYAITGYEDSNDVPSSAAAAN